MQPKAERRAGLAQEHFNETNALIELLDKLSSRLTSLVKLEDAFIDQLMELKQLAWVARNAGGDASVWCPMRSAGSRCPPMRMLRYTTNVSQARDRVVDARGHGRRPAAAGQVQRRSRQRPSGNTSAADYTDLRDEGR